MAGAPSAWKRVEPPLLFVAALLIIAALASNLANLTEPLPETPGARAGSASSRGILSAEILAILAWMFAAAVLVLLLGIYVWVRRGAGRRVPISDLRGVLVGIGILILLLLLWPLIGPAAQNPPVQQLNNATAEPPGGTVIPPSLQALRGVPVVMIVFAVAAFAFALATMSRGFSSRRGVPEPESEAAAEPRTVASRAVRKTIQDIEAGLDPREAILRCYAILSLLLTRRGLEGMEPLTPREVQRRALSQFGLSRDDIEDLTSVFEEARYSEHTMGPYARDRAVLAFSRLRAVLGGPAA